MFKWLKSLFGEWVMQRSYRDGEDLTQDELAYIAKNLSCPDCHFGGLTEGPSGGLSVNRYCVNPECGSRFNDQFVFGWQRISDASPNKPAATASTGPYR